jgi:hypothetical protein
VNNAVKLRSFNSMGMEKFVTFISESREADDSHSPRPVVPTHLLTDPELLDLADFGKEVDPNVMFDSRYDLGAYLDAHLGADFLKKYYECYGLWAWLALLWFDQLRPSKKTTNRHEHFIPYEWFKNPSHYFSDSRPLGYRHCIRGPFETVCMLGEQAKFFLSRNVSSLGDATEQLLSTKLILSSNKLRELLLERYADKSGWPRKNAFDVPPPAGLANLKKKGFGQIRRLVRDVLPRVKLTYDIDAMAVPRILSVCGEEFEESKPRRRVRKRRR